MNTKLSALLLGAVILMAFQSINDVVTEVGSTLKDVKQITLEQISKNDFDLPRYTMQVREACKKLPPGVREATMMNLGKVVKDYVKSPSFEAEYMAFIEKKATGPRGAPPMDDAKIAEEKKKRVDQTMKSMSNPDMVKLNADMVDVYIQGTESKLQMLQQSPGVNVGKTKEELEQELKELKEIKSLYPKDVEGFKIKYTEFSVNEQMKNQMKTYNKHNAQKQQKVNELKDYKSIITKQLQQFLDVSGTVDYNAQTVQKGDKLVFANANYESKPLTWKLCYRCGKEAVTGARKFAQEWLNEIKAGK